MAKLHILPILILKYYYSANAHWIKNLVVIVFEYRYLDTRYIIPIIIGIFISILCIILKTVIIYQY